jgi:hypothetical protein
VPVSRRRFALDLHAAFLKDFGDVRRDPAFVLYFFWNRFDAVTPQRVAFQHPALLHPHQQRLGPLGIFVEFFLAARAPGDLLDADKLIAPGLQKMKNFALFRIHARQ